MPDVTKPVILDETGQVFNQKIQAFSDALPQILEAINELDIIWYVEQDNQ